MTDLEQILADMDESLFKDGQMEGITEKEEALYKQLQASSNNTGIFEEEIPYSLAKRILGDDKVTDVDCTYKLITSQDGVIITKFDPRLTDADIVTNKEGVIVKGPIVEYPLNSADEVEDYAEMLYSASNGPRQKTTDLNVYRDIYKHVPKHTFLFYFGISVFTALTVLGVLLFVYCRSLL